jgi:2-polyprenyl-3-methyl-5-hydroxy-6-metoxy-1,4-benzoquinol methylase
MSVSAEGVRSSYETWHDRLATDKEADAPWHRLVKQHLEPGRDLRDKRLLEIACGRGGFSCWLASQPIRPHEIVAVDFAATAITKGEAFAAQRRLAGITWEIGDIQNLVHADESFDTVVSCETIEHVADPIRAVQELARVLKPGGRLLLTTPNYLGTMGLYRAYMRLTGRKYTEEGQPINNFMLLPLTRASIASAGLRVTSVDGVGHYLPFPGRPPIEVPMLNNPRFLMRWLALHSLVIAEKS